MKIKLCDVVIALLILAPLGVHAQTPSTNSGQADSSALILSLQKQVLQLLTQIQALQKEVTELKTETGIQTSPPISPVSPISPLTPISTEEAELPELTRSLAPGSRGDDVRKLQEFLARDKEIYPEGLATGFYGPKTAEAVRRWQKKNNLDAVGIVGPKTISRFRELGQGVVRGLMEQGTPSGMVPPGLMMAPGIQRQMDTSTSSGQATTTPMVMPPVIATTTPAIPAEPATPAVPGVTSAVPATPAQPATPATSSSNELKVTYPNGGETWYKGNSYTITWQNPFQNGFTGDTSYRWVVGLKRGNTSYGGDSITTVPVTQSSIVWNQWTFPDPNVSVWTGQTAPLPDASDYKAFVSLLDLCASQVGGICPSANISIIPSGGIDYSDGYFTATSTPPATTSAGTAPTISDVQTTNITSNTAVIIWNTDRSTDTQVEYGLNNLYGLRTTLDNSLVTSHSANLTGLNPAATYHYRVKSKDASGYYATMNDYTFTTLSSATTDIAAPTITLAVGYPNLTAQTQPVYVGFNASEEVKVVYEYGPTASYGSTLNVWDSYWTSNGIYLPTLSSGATYHIRAKATDRAGNIGYSQDYTFTTAGGVSTIPANASAVTGYVNGETVNINWTDNSSNETSFDIYRRSSGLNVTPGAWTKIAAAYSNMNNQADFPGAGTWEYRVDACNSAGCASNSGTVQLTVSSNSSSTATTTSAILDSLSGLLIKLLELLKK